MSLLPSNRLFAVVGWATVAVTVAIPKAGFKVASVPVTLSLVLWCAMLLLGWLEAAAVASRSDKSPIGWGRAARFFFFSLTIISVIEHGPAPTFLVAVPMLLPIFGVDVLTRLWEATGIETSYTYLRRIMIIPVGYGILQILFGRSRVVVPGVTVNWSDWQEFGDFVFATKNNSTAVGLKLASTYQNGNLYAFFLIAALAFFLSDALAGTGSRVSWLMSALSATSVVLTLSRSGLLGAAVALVALLFTVGRRWSPALLVAIFTGSLWVASSGVSERLFKVDASGSGRVPLFLEWWREVALLGGAELARFVVVGFGPGFEGLRDETPSDKIDLDGLPFTETAVPNVIMVGGLIGLALFVAPFFRVLWHQRSFPGPIAPAISGFGVFLILEQAMFLTPTIFLVAIVVSLAGVGPLDREERGRGALTLREPPPARSLVAPTLNIPRETWR